MGGAQQEIDAQPPAARRRVEVAADAANVTELRRVARDFALESGAGRTVAADVALAVTEAATNAVVHAFLDRPPGRVSLVCEAAPDQLRVRVIDDGRGMQPRTDSPGLGLGLSTMGAVALAMDVRQGNGGQGTEVELTFAAPGVRPLGVERPAREQRLLDAASRLARTAAWPEAGVERVVELLCGELGDAATIDLVHQGTVRRYAARVDGDPSLTEWLAGRPPPAKPGTATWAAVHGAGAHLVVHDPAAARPPGGIGEQLDLAWWLAVPLEAPVGRSVGLLGLGGRGARPVPTEGEQRLVREVAARVARGLSSARALEDLRTTRRRIERILGRLRDAVLVSGPGGRLVYANEAAVRLLGAASVQELLATEPGELARRFGVTAEEGGTPASTEGWPFAAAGTAALVTRNVHRASGAVSWTRTTTTSLEDAAGRLRLHILEDITDERAARRAGAAVGRPRPDARPARR